MGEPRKLYEEPSPALAGTQITGRRTAYRGFTQLESCTVQFPQGGPAEREVVLQGDAAAVLPYDLANRNILLVRQFRPPAALHADHPDGLLLEACAGMIDAGETPAEAVRREAAEELGINLVPESLSNIGCFFASPGVLRHKLHLFLAEYSADCQAGAGGGLAGEAEFIDVVRVSFDELAGLMADRDVADMKTWMLLTALQAKRSLLERARA